MRKVYVFVEAFYASVALLILLTMAANILDRQWLATAANASALLIVGFVWFLTRKSWREDVEESKKRQLAALTDLDAQLEIARQRQERILKRIEARRKREGE